MVSKNNKTLCFNVVGMMKIPVGIQLSHILIHACEIKWLYLEFLVFYPVPIRDDDFRGKTVLIFIFLLPIILYWEEKSNALPPT